MAELPLFSVPADRRVLLLGRWGALKNERASWLSHWKDCSDFILPRSGRFFVQDRNSGGKRNNAIYDSSATYALEVLGAGLMATATSPARRWFKLRTEDSALNEFHSVRVWLDQVTKLMETIFQKSNTYRALHQIYEELGTFGTAVSIVLPDFENVIHHYLLTAGEYCIASDWQGRVCTLYREFQKTVGETVKEFGFENCSPRTKDMFKAGQLDQWITIVHAIEPRADRNPAKADARNMPWGSYYFELSGEAGQFLRESGFKYFPALAPRWSVSGGDIYGRSPAMTALGDVKQLQHEQLRKAQGIDYATKPPIQVPSNMKNREVDTLPGGVTYYDASGSTGAIRSMWDVKLDLAPLLGDIQDVRARIEKAFHTNAFIMLANDIGTGRMTATEVAERHEEKLLMLGPVAERLHTELLSPLIETTFQQMIVAGILPPAPDEVRGLQIAVDFVSVLAQAQRAVGVNSVDRWLGSVAQVAEFRPDVVDNVDTDYWCSEYAAMLGVDPKMIVDEKIVAQSRQARARAEQQAAATAQAEQASSAIKNVAQAGAADASAGGQLTDLMSQFSGYNSPAPSEV